jgi:hypothetical protein
MNGATGTAQNSIIKKNNLFTHKIHDQYFTSIETVFFVEQKYVYGFIGEHMHQMTFYVSN